jgi:tRNA A-37 threonylcarbamoyl transferase component Bud32
MDKLPKKIEIKADKTYTVSCETLIRSIPGNRQVFKGVWDDTEVIVKIFYFRLRAVINMHREWNGLKLLQQKGLPAPEALFYGKTGDGGRAVVTRKIKNCEAVFKLLEEETDSRGKYDIIKPVFCYTAYMHSKGVGQKDLHTGNFLTDGQRIYALDPAEMFFYDKPLSRQKSLKQIAMLIVSLPVYIRKNYQDLLKAYLNCRDMKISEKDNKKLLKYIAHYTEKSHKKSLKKSLRNSKRYTSIKNGQASAVFRKEFACDVAVSDFLENLDKLTENGEIIKDGGASFVSRFKPADREIVVKRYNHKGIWHCLRHTIKGSRARKSWLNAHTLLMLDIKTPNPLAFIEIRKFGLLWKSYIITEFILARNLHEFLQNPQTSPADIQKIKNKLEHLLERFAESKIVHGDMKKSNILIRNGEIILTDLDAMNVFKSRLLFSLRKNKDTNSLENIILSETKSNHF